MDNALPHTQGERKMTQSEKQNALLNQYKQFIKDADKMLTKVAASCTEYEAVRADLLERSAEWADRLALALDELLEGME